MSVKSIIGIISSGGVNPPLVLADTRVDMYGQSNCGGVTEGVSAPLEYQSPSPTAYFIGRKYGATPVETFVPVTQSNGLGSIHGAELSIGFELVTCWINKVYRGGSSIAILSKGHGLDVYGQFLTMIQSAEIQKTVQNRVLYYDQFEGDLNTTKEDYKDGFIQLITDLETDGGFTYDLMIHVRPRDQDGQDYSHLVEAVDELVNHYGGRYVSLNGDDLERSPNDDVHYTSPSQITLGTRAATIIKNNLI